LPCLLEIGLCLQPADSGLYIPSYIHHEEPPQLLEALKEQYPAFMDMPWLKQGITMLWCPFGVDSYVQDVLEQVCNIISDRANDFAQVDDGLVHLQLHKFSANAMLPYF
jgi:hypothetical protein